MAGRRPRRASMHPEFEFASDVECEESDKYGGRHLIEPSVWPPKAQHGETNPTLAARCKRCGSTCIVTGDNDPEDSGIEVVIPRREGQKIGA